VLDLGDGRRFLRLDNLRTSNGPDLFVYLSVTPTGGQRDTFDDNFVSLGRLKGNLGNQNYEIAPSVDLRQPERRHLVPPFHLRVRGGAVALTAHGGLLAGSRPGEVIGGIRARRDGRVQEGAKMVAAYRQGAEAAVAATLARACPGQPESKGRIP
jgi:hypothetical protein